MKAEKLWFTLFKKPIQRRLIPRQSIRFVWLKSPTSILLRVWLLWLKPKWWAVTLKPSSCATFACSPSTSLQFWWPRDRRRKTNCSLLWCWSTWYRTRSPSWASSPTPLDPKLSTSKWRLRLGWRRKEPGTEKLFCLCKRNLFHRRVGWKLFWKRTKNVHSISSEPVSELTDKRILSIFAPNQTEVRIYFHNFLTRSFKIQEDHSRYSKKLQDTQETSKVMKN